MGAVGGAASITCAAPSRRPACRGSIRSTAGCMFPRPTTATNSRLCRAAALDRRRGRGLADRTGARALLNTDRYFSAVHFPTRLPHPSAQLRARPRAPRRKKPAPAFSRTPRRSRSIAAGVRKRIARRSGRVRADHVVLAGNVASRRAHAAARGDAAAGVDLCDGDRAARRPAARGRALIAARSATPIAPTITTASSAATGRCRLQWSGRMRAWAGRSARDLRARLVRRHRCAIYPQLGKVEIAHLWRGTLGRTGAPHAADRRNLPGSGWRAASAATASTPRRWPANLIARAIVEGDETWRLFAPYELVWAGGCRPRAGAGRLFGRQLARPRQAMVGARQARSSACAKARTRRAAAARQAVLESGHDREMCRQAVRRYGRCGRDASRARPADGDRRERTSAAERALAGRAAGRVSALRGAS